MSKNINTLINGLTRLTEMPEDTRRVGRIIAGSYIQYLVANRGKVGFSVAVNMIHRSLSGPPASSSEGSGGLTDAIYLIAQRYFNNKYTNAFNATKSSLGSAIGAACENEPATVMEFVNALSQALDGWTSSWISSGEEPGQDK